MHKTQPLDQNVAATTNTQSISLHQLLKKADLIEYNDKLRSVLKLRHAGDFEYVDEKDLTRIGMSRPEQKRLRREYQNLFPQSSFVVRLRKVFGRMDGRQSEIEGETKFDNGVPDDQHIIPSDAVEICRELGRGDFGVCYQGSWTLPHGDSIQVAIKRVLPEKLRSNPSSFLHEASVMTKMRHDHVIRMYGVVLDTKSVMLVSEIAPFGSLLECLRNPAWDEPFAVDKLCEFTRQIACGMTYLSNQRLIHRDLAARNVLVSTLSKVKISDFGLSRWLGAGEDYYRSDHNPTMKLPIAWCAPECINVLRFTSASDVYAYGVTLYEMFSYGELPWQGLTGSQILHAIDTQRRILSCPSSCPSQFYSLMRRCWSHDSDQRPKFEEIEQMIPDLMPQLLISAIDCHNRREGHLQFNKGEIIILLDKRWETPTEGGLWHGALRSGQTGLFKPEDTVAYLGAENPISSNTAKLLQLTKENKPTKKRSSEKLTDKEKRKLLISEPQGLKHTCHVGLDGKVFGLIHMNKNDLAKNLPPLIGLSDPATLSIATAVNSINNVASSSTSPAARSTTTIASSSTSPCSSNANQRFGHPPPPSSSSSCTSPTLASVRELRSLKSDTIIQNGYDIPQRMPRQFHVPPPALPPKPAARIKPQKNLLAENNISVAPPRPPSHRTQSLPKPANNGSCSSTILTSSSSFRELARPKSITVESGEILVDSKATTEPVDNMSHSFHDSSQLLDEILTDLQKDISNFSLSTINDFSDTRPLLDKEKRECLQDPSQSQSICVRHLNGDEGERLTKRISDEHKKAARSLAKEFEQFKRVSSVGASRPERNELDNGCDGGYSSKIGSTSTEAWSSEAQAAYKLLIECGHDLKSTSPNGDRMSKSPNAYVSSSTDTESTVKNPPLPPKKIEYINNTLIGSENRNREESPQVERVEIVEQRQTLSSYENMKPGDERSFNLPPKPKARQNIPLKDPSEANKKSTGHFAPVVQQTALFSSFPTDEVVKF